MAKPLEQSFASFLRKILTIIEHYYSRHVWADLSTAKQGNARLFHDFLVPYANMRHEELNRAKLANAAFFLRSELARLEAKHALRKTGEESSPATLPPRVEGAISFTATPSQAQLTATIGQYSLTVGIVCLIKLGVLVQLHQCKTARVKHPGIIALLTFSSIHDVGQYEGILSALDRTCSGFLKICDVTEKLVLTTEAADPNHSCAQLILLLADMLCDLTFDCELLSFSREHHTISPDFFLRRDILALTDAQKKLLPQVINTFYNSLYYLATRTMKLRDLTEKEQDVQGMVAILEDMHSRNPGFPQLPAVISAENLRRFNELHAASAGASAGASASTSASSPRVEADPQRLQAHASQGLAKVALGVSA